MANIGILLGTGYLADDVLYKLPWIKYLDKKHNVFVASRIDPWIHVGETLKAVSGNRLYHDIKISVDELIRTVKSFDVLYKSPYLKKNFSSCEVEEMEKWLGYSFRYIATFDQAFYNKEKMVDSRDDRLIIYCTGLTCYFKEFFTKNKIDVFITNLEDDIFSVTAYYVAKRLNIKIISLSSGRFPKKGFMFCEGFSGVCIWSEKSIDWDEIMSMYEESTIVGKETLDKNARYYSLTSLFDRLRGINFAIQYRKFVNHITKHYQYEKYIIDCTNLWREIYKYLLKFYRRFMIRRLLKEPDYSDNYILFPLHFTDDAQITFLEPMLDQFKIIENVSRALPTSCYLYVKPHPHYFGEDVSFKELSKVSKLKNVKIINPMIPPAKLIKNSRGLITINSTAGFEAIIAGVPVITLGHDFYCSDGLCRVIRDINDMPGALLEVMTGGKLDREKAMKFVKIVYANTIWFNGVSYDFGYYGITDEEGKQLALALNKILDDYHTYKA